MAPLQPFSLLLVCFRLVAPALQLRRLLRLEGGEISFIDVECALAQLPDAAAQPLQHGPVVAHEHKALELLHAPAEELHALPVEVRGRLIRQQQRGAAAEGIGQFPAGLLAAAEHGAVRRAAAQAEAAQFLGGGAAALRFVPGELFKEGDRTAARHPPLLRRQTAGQDGQQRRFSAPVRPHQADPVARVDGERSCAEQKPFPRKLRERRGFQQQFRHKKTSRVSGGRRAKPGCVLWIAWARGQGLFRKKTIRRKEPNARRPFSTHCARVRTAALARRQRAKHPAGSCARSAPAHKKQAPSLFSQNGSTQQGALRPCLPISRSSSGVRFRFEYSHLSGDLSFLPGLTAVLRRFCSLF